jgi:hypothetical protein
VFVKMCRPRLLLGSPMLSRRPSLEISCPCISPLTTFEPIDGYFWKLTKCHNTRRSSTFVFSNFLYSPRTMTWLREPPRWEQLNVKLWEAPSKTMQLYKNIFAECKTLLLPQFVFRLGIFGGKERTIIYRDL